MLQRRKQEIFEKLRFIFFLKMVPMQEASSPYPTKTNT